MKQDETFSPGQEAAIELLARGVRLSEISRELDLSRTTLWRWRRDPEFDAELRRRRAEIWGIERERLQAMLTQSLGILEQQLAEGNVNVAEFVTRVAGIWKVLTD